MAGFDTRHWPDFWDFTTSPPSMVPVDIAGSDRDKLTEIMHAYPDPAVAHQARVQLSSYFTSFENFWYL